jgi:hypothetical protein
LKRTEEERAKLLLFPEIYGGYENRIIYEKQNFSQYVTD